MTQFTNPSKNTLQSSSQKDEDSHDHNSHSHENGAHSSHNHGENVDFAETISAEESAPDLRVDAAISSTRNARKVAKTAAPAASCCSHCAPEITDEHGHSHGSDDATGFFRAAILRPLACGILALAAWIWSRATTEDVLPTEVVALYAVALLVGGWPLLRGALRSLGRFSLDMNVLMSAAIIGAAVLGDWPEAASLVVLYSFSEALEEWSLNRSRRSMTALLQLTPTHVALQRDGATVEVEADEVQIGDVFLVRTGERIALDGVVVAGNSGVDQAPVTGESVPVEKNVGDEVFAGSLNSDRVLEVRATRPASDGTVARIAKLVGEAASQKSPRQRATEIFARRYTPFVFAAAILLAVAPPLLFQAEWRASITRGLSLLVAACPCAFVIGGPIATICALSAAAKRGILVRQSSALETLALTKIVALDKTGTLTEGAPKVQDFRVFRGDETELLAIAATLEARSSHPLARAVVDFAATRSSSTRNAEISVEDVQEEGGSGVRGRVNGEIYRVARANRWNLPDEIAAQIRALENDGKSVALLGTENEALAAFGFADEIRPEAHRVLEMLRARGVTQNIVLSGDNEDAVRNVAQSVGATSWQGALLPSQKLNEIENLTKRGVTAMLGDGINDAPALARADIGIAVGAKASAISTQTADITLLNGGLSQLPFAFDLSRRTKGVIVQNLAFALGLKLVFVVGLLLGVWGNWQLVGGVIADMGATVLVTANGLRLLRH